MGYRRFRDRDGNEWDVKDDSGSEWHLLPVSGNPRPRLSVRAPGYENDPFELSNEELQRMLDAARAARTSRSKNPFLE